MIIIKSFSSVFSLLPKKLKNLHNSFPSTGVLSGVFSGFVFFFTSQVFLGYLWEFNIFKAITLLIVNSN